MLRPGVYGRHQDQALQARVVLSTKVSFSANGCDHDGDASAVRGSQQVEVFDAESVGELEDAPGGGTHSAVHAVVGRRESSAQIVDGVNGGMGRESGDGESPGKGVAHQAMNQDERRAGASLEVAHASVGEIEPMLFDHGCGSGAGVGLADGDELFFGILRFDGQRNPRGQVLTN